MATVRSIGFALVLLMGIGCGPTAPQVEDTPKVHSPPKVVQTPLPAAPWRISYRDGSNNGFTFRQATPKGPVEFAYSPVTPLQSSSGTYSGGSPRKGSLTPEQTRTLWKWVRQLLAQKALHLKDRPKASGAFSFATPSGSASFVIRAGKEHRQFGRFVAAFRAP